MQRIRSQFSTMRLLWAVLALSLCSRVLAQVICDSSCTGQDPANPISCYYCPSQCGTCAENGVVTQCQAPGTVHIAMQGAPISSTNAMMDALLSANIKASFFLIGEFVEANAFVVQRMASDGHYIGSNSYTHLHANNLTVTDLPTLFGNDELAKTKQVIQSSVAPTYTAAQVPVAHYSAPFAELNKNVLAVVKSAGYTPVLWNLDVRDFTEDEATMQGLLNTTIANSDPRTTSFILQYTATGPVAQGFLPKLIAQMQAAGYKFVSAHDCYNAPSSTSTAVSGSGSSSTTTGATGASGATGATGNNNNGGSTTTNTTHSFPSPAAIATPAGFSMQLAVTLVVSFVALLAWAL